jgi:hypothetical protein
LLLILITLPPPTAHPDRPFSPRYNGFNPITGQVDPNRSYRRDINNWLLDGKPSKVQVGEGPSTELQRIGHIQLRDSLSR